MLQNMLDEMKGTVNVASLFSLFYFCHITVSSLICIIKKGMVIEVGRGLLVLVPSIFQSMY